MIDDPLLARVLEAAPSLPFVSLVHWLERLLNVEVGAVGQDVLALRHDPALAFHASDLTAGARHGEPGLTVTTAFAGLTGAVSPLPTSALEALARDDERELPEHALLDVLHHRLLSLFYRGLRARDPARDGEASPAHAWLLALAGVPADGLAHATTLPRATVLRLAPLLVLHPPNAARLRLALRDQLGPLLGAAEVRVAALCGGNVALAEEARPRLGVDLRLGPTSTLGARCPAPASAIALTLAPLSPEAFLALRPGGSHAALLTGVVQLLVPESLAVEITLCPLALPAARLGHARLRTAWLAHGSMAASARFTLC